MKPARIDHAPGASGHRAFYHIILAQRIHCNRETLLV
jgi:hypothetical protein